MRPPTRSFANQPSRIRPVLMLVIFLTLLLSLGCGGQHNAESAKYQIELLPPEFGDTYLLVRLSDDAGQPVTNALVSAEGNMNHAGMVPVISGPVHDADAPSADGEDDGSADGVYRIPFEFTMLGDWIITVTAVVEAAAGQEATRDFDLTVRSDGTILRDP